MSYLKHYGFKFEPFNNAPDRRFFWSGASYERALAKLKFVADRRRGLAVCTGPVGHGKTTLARRLYDELPDRKYHKGLLVVIHSDVTAQWLLKKIAEVLGVKEITNDKVELLGRIYSQLRKIHSMGKKTVILIDEVQMLASRELMEEFRGLLNIEVQGFKLINFIFFGLPETEKVLALDPPLKDRIALRAHLEPLDISAAMRYVAHRIETAGGDPDIFSDRILRQVHTVTGGAPRQINTLCDNLLLEAFLTGDHNLTVDLVNRLAGEMGLTKRSVCTVLDELFGAGDKDQVRAEIEADWTVDSGDEIDQILSFLDK